MKRFSIFMSAVLLLSSVALAETIPFPAVAPKSKEVFRSYPTWETTEDLAWRVATEAGVTGAARRVWIAMIWNESRGKALVHGDNGCATGLGQLHVGGTDTFGKKCRADNRVLLPEDLRYLPTSAFWDPEINLRASVHIFRTRGGDSRPLDAASNYAGFLSSKSSKARRFLGKLRHWLDTGLEKRLLERERTQSLTMN